MLQIMFALLLLLLLIDNSPSYSLLLHNTTTATTTVLLPLIGYYLVLPLASSSAATKNVCMILVNYEFSLATIALPLLVDWLLRLTVLVGDAVGYVDSAI